MAVRIVFSILFFVLTQTAILVAEDYEIVLPMLPVDSVPVSGEQKDAAEKLFNQATDAAKNGNGTEAMRLAIRALEADPNHERFRNILGFRLHDGQWRTGWEIDRLKKGFVDHPKFGWMPSEYVEKYDAGKRLFRNRWIEADEETRFRTKIENGWNVDSEHYELQTNHSLEEGVRTVRELEHLYRAWKLLFFNFLLSDETLAKMFQGRSSSGSLPRHKVLLYRDKNDYVENLKGIEPNIAISNGYYSTRTKKSYFFPVAPEMDADDAEHVRKTLYHEGTHQLFQEARLTGRNPGLQSNFWLVEGIAMFMETFRIRDNRYIIGNVEDSRLYAAWAQKNEHKFYVPFGTLVRLGAADFISSPDIRKIYSQSAGMTHFLMFAESAKNRDAVILLLRQIYSESDRADSLSRLTGKSYQELDDAYTKFLDDVRQRLK